MFLNPDALNGAMHNDKVWVRETGQSPRGSKEGEVAIIAERFNKRVVGTFQTDGLGGGYVVPDETRLMYDVMIPAGQVKTAKSGEKVVAEITAYPDEHQKLTGKITEVLGSKYAAGTDILSVIRRFDLPDSFPKAALRLAESLNAPVPEDEIARREDLRSGLTITIDGADAKDLDDAVSLTRLKNGNYLLGVHIADVSHYAAEKSAIDKEAYKRGTSVYFPDRVLPMFPTDISNGVCSLNEKEPKLTLSCIMEVNWNGEVVSYRLAETVIETAHRMTYDAVNAIFADDPAMLKEYADVAPMLIEMRELMRILNTQRVKRGSIDFDLDEAKITLDDKGRALEVKLHERREAERMIEEFMLLANETVARHIGGLNIPLMYRVHETPDSEKLESLSAFLETLGYGIKSHGDVKPMHFQRLLNRVKGTPEENVVNRVTLRSLRKARYSEHNFGHFGLASEHYCHFTSPIRRYPDLVVHRIVRESLKGGMNKRRIAHWKAYLPEASQHCSDREVAAVEAERMADNLKKCEYMLGRIGMVESGIISGVTQYGFYVELPNTVEGMVRLSAIEGDYYICDEKNYRIVGKNTGKTFRLGDEVKVLVAGVDMENANISFELVLGKGAKPAKGDSKEPRKAYKTPRSDKERYPRSGEKAEREGKPQKGGRIPLLGGVAERRGGEGAGSRGGSKKPHAHGPKKAHAGRKTRRAVEKRRET
jgi:ribonuclease R